MRQIEPVRHLASQAVDIRDGKMLAQRVQRSRLLGSEAGVSRLRGRFHEYRGIPLMPTYHPAALLRNPALARRVAASLAAIKQQAVPLPPGAVAVPEELRGLPVSVRAVLADLQRERKPGER